MKIVKKVSMVRYMARNLGADKEIFGKELWFADKEKPNVPYYKIKVTIIEIEDRYKQERGNGRKPVRDVRGILKHV